MELPVERIKELQRFLLGAAREYVGAAGEKSDADGLLTSAAGLDYILLLASERPTELVDSSAAVAAGARRTLTTAVLAALAFVRAKLAMPAEAFDDYMDRQACGAPILETLRALVTSGGLDSPEVAFAMLTIANDLHERRRR